MYLVRLIYASKASDRVTQEDIQQIVASAKENNGKSELSGLLCFNRKYFLQVLEGSRSKVNATYRHIMKDPRHTDVVLISYEEIAMRKFEQWHMGYVPEAGINSEISLRYSGHRGFDPYEMSGESCLGMMLELRETVPVV